MPRGHAIPPVQRRLCAAMRFRVMFRWWHVTRVVRFFLIQVNRPEAYGQQVWRLCGFDENVTITDRAKSQSTRTTYFCRRDEETFKINVEISTENLLAIMKVLTFYEWAMTIARNNTVTFFLFFNNVLPVRIDDVSTNHTTSRAACHDIVGQAL